MKQHREKKITTLWKDLLQSALIRSEKKKANILVLGNPQNGKKSIINAMIKLLGVEEEELTKDQEKKQINEHIYIFDYKFLRINQFFEEEDSEEAGTINFFLLNKQYPHLKSFLREQMFENLMIMLVMDLSKPGEVTHEFIEWISYINHQIMPFIMEIQNNQLKDKMNINYNLFFQKNKQIINSEATTENIDLTAKNEEIESSFGIPLLICGNKSDCIDQLKDEKAIDHLQYILRSFAMKYGSSLIFTSTLPNSNIKFLAEYLAHILLERESQNLQVKLDYQLFIPSGYDQQQLLQERFADSMDHLFPRDNEIQSRDSLKQEEKINCIQDFLKDLKEANERKGRETIFNQDEIKKLLNKKKTQQNFILNIFYFSNSIIFFFIFFFGQKILINHFLIMMFTCFIFYTYCQCFFPWSMIFNQCTLKFSTKIIWQIFFTNMLQQFFFSTACYNCYFFLSDRIQPWFNNYPYTLEKVSSINDKNFMHQFRIIILSDLC